MALDKSLLSSQQLKRLSEHKYSSESISICDRIFQPWWNFVVSLVPMWMAPNLITIVGLAINIVTSIILMYYCPTATEKPPSWAPIASGLGLFIYQTLDAIDGKQARRTGTSNPLGELFDHGCDSLSTVFVTLASACAVGLGQYPTFMMFQCFCASALFYCAHWQTYVTGTMRFGRIDVTEGQICVIVVMFLSGIFGAEFWEYELLGMLPVKIVPVIFGSVIGTISLLITLQIISAGGAGKNGSTVAGTSVLTPAIPLALVIVPAVVIAQKSEQFVFENHPILYILTFGLIASKITNKLVVAHMCKSEMHHRDPSLLAPLVLFLNQYFNTYLPEYPLLLLSFVFVVADLMWYCSRVCLEICNYLDVFLFKIPVTSSLGTAMPSATNGNRVGSGIVTRSRAAAVSKQD